MMCANSPPLLSLTVSRSRDTLLFFFSRGFTPPGAVAGLIDVKIDANASYASRRKTHNGSYALDGLGSLFVKVLRYLITMITIIIIIIILLLALLHT